MRETHLVITTEPARLEQWFKTRLPYTAPIQDLPADGYALVGGRLDCIYQQPLAAVAYLRVGSYFSLLREKSCP